MDKRGTPQVYGLAEWWTWPFGFWREATDSWIEYCSHFLGGEGCSGGKAGSPFFPGMMVDPWAVLRLWLPHVDAVIETVDLEGGKAFRVSLKGPVDSAELAGTPVVVDAEAKVVVEQPAAPKKAAAPRRTGAKKEAPPHEK